MTRPNSDTDVVAVGRAAENWAGREGMTWSEMVRSSMNGDW